ncbi:DUF952 domain-containing protein [uncultured Shewanella sp.]|uniref:DUF952 domain-containing protein n=1 Tax=uncultured Shewanella sp. TaxID=173975 RepID=UPI0026395B8F|nr:DUF952 domain-containing protein [uncultured Shewanella sp.]
MKNLYHLLQQADLNRLKESEEYEPDSLVLDGFIHLAYKEQLPFILQQFFVPALLKSGLLSEGEGLQNVGLYLVEIAFAKLTAKVVDELAVGLNKLDSLELYPHLYGGLNREAILTISALHINAQGDYLISAL